MIDRINGRLALLLSIGAVLLVVLVGWYVLVAPQRSKASALGAQIGDAQIKLAATQAFLRSGSGRRSVADLRRLRVAIPDEVRMSDILRQLAWAAGRTGVRIDTLTPSAPVPTAGAQTVPIALSVTGHYFRIAKFMHLLRTRADVSAGNVHASGRLYAVDNISFSNSDKSGAISATLALDAFVYGTTSAATAATTTASPDTTSPTTGP